MIGERVSDAIATGVTKTQRFLPESSTLRACLRSKDENILLRAIARCETNYRINRDCPPRLSTLARATRTFKSLGVALDVYFDSENLVR